MNNEDFIIILFFIVVGVFNILGLQVLRLGSRDIVGYTVYLFITLIDVFGIRKNITFLFLLLDLMIFTSYQLLYICNRLGDSWLAEILRGELISATQLQQK